MHEIITTAADLFEVSIDELTSASRRLRVTKARHAAAWALRWQYKDLSLSEIGRLLGGRNHTTIMYGIDAAEQRAISDADYALALSALLTH